VVRKGNKIAKKSFKVAGSKERKGYFLLPTTLSVPFSQVQSYNLAFKSSKLPWKILSSTHPTNLWAHVRVNLPQIRQ
jgi:hypothetical protein